MGKTADGVIRGAYSYVDSDGIVQTVNYIADALGFRVGATNLPVHHVDAAPVAAPVVKAATPVVPVVSANVDAANSQYHAQDDFKQYNYGYSNPLSTKQELKTADGVTRGSYSYVDANGLVQTVNYISDALGFKVAATNLPVHHVEGPHAEPVPEVQEAQVVEEPVVAAYKGVMEPAVDYSYLPYAQNYEYYGAAASVPVPVADTTYANVVSKP